MALALGFSAGQDFYAGDTRVKVMKIRADLTFDLEVWPPNGDKQVVHITDMESTEVAPNVRLSMGNTGTEGTARILIEAPKHIKVLRGNAYRRDQKRSRLAS